jgi:hypothetical protein
VGLLRHVKIVSRNDVWAGGDGNNGPLILHWDGHGWSAPVQPHATSVRAIAVTPGGAVWLAEPLQRWDGQKWRWSRPVHWFFAIDDLAAISENDLWAVGFHVRRTATDRAFPELAHYSCG